MALFLDIANCFSNFKISLCLKISTHIITNPNQKSASFTHIKRNMNSLISKINNINNIYVLRKFYGKKFFTFNCHFAFSNMGKSFWYRLSSLCRRRLKPAATFCFSICSLLTDHCLLLSLRNPSGPGPPAPAPRRPGPPGWRRESPSLWAAGSPPRSPFPGWPGG